MARRASLLHLLLDVEDRPRGVRERLDLRLSVHPSEAADRVVVRALAYALLYEPGLTFGKGLSTTEEPALWLRAPGGRVSLWVDVGAPSAERLERARRRADRVVVVSDREARTLRRALRRGRLRRPEEVEIRRLPRGVVAALAEGLGRRASWRVRVSSGGLEVTTVAGRVSGSLVRWSAAELLASPQG